MRSHGDAITSTHPPMMRTSRLRSMDELVPEVWVERGRDKLSRKRYWDAVADLDRAIEITPEDAQIRELRGTCFLRLDFPSVAWIDLDHLVERRRTVESLSLRAEALIGMTKYDDALVDVEDALNLMAPAQSRYKRRLLRMRRECVLHAVIDVSSTPASPTSMQ